MDFKDYYKTLGVPRTADADAIKTAYRKLARQYHPDRNTAAGAAEKMSAINEAHTVLSDAEKRAAYDALGPDGMQGGGFRPPPGWGGRQGFGAEGMQGGEHFSDFFASMFGQQGGARGFDGMGGQSRRARATRGEDSEARLEIDLGDAYAGVAKTITLSGGTHGASRQIEVTIPKGIRAGQRIRLAGYGQPGAHGGPAGDLLLEVAFRPDARYQIDGRDITQFVPVTPWEAALGGEITLHTLAGELTVTVPAGSSTGRKLRLKGRGLPGQPAAGDYYLALQVAVPAADTEEARAFYSGMAERFAGFRPRG
ncbi:DnaJ C-terminal domain-containing protein [Comamonadaceae bacterium PP-2]